MHHILYCPKRWEWEVNHACKKNEFIYHKQVSVSTAVHKLEILGLHLAAFAPLFLFLPLLLPLLLRLPLFPLDVLLALELDEGPPALHPLAAEDGEARRGFVLRHLDAALL